MKLKSLCPRNITVKSDYPEKGGLPTTVNIVAGSHLELADAEYKLVQKRLDLFVQAKLIKIIEDVAVTMTIAEITAALKEAGVEVDSKMTKPKLVDLAKSMDIELH